MTDAATVLAPFLRTKVDGLPFALASTEPSSIFSEKVTVGLALGETFLPFGLQLFTVGLAVSTVTVRTLEATEVLPAASLALTV